MTEPRVSFWRRIPRPRLSLRVQMLGVLVFGGSFGWYVTSVRRQQQIVAEIERMGGSVDYGLSYEDRGSGEEISPRWKKWLIDRLGIDAVCSVTGVEVSSIFLAEVVTPEPELDRRRRSDNLAELLAGLPRLESVAIDDPTFNDAHFAGLAGKTRMREVFINESALTGSCLVHLRKMSQLRRLTLRNVVIRDVDLAEIADLTDLKQLEFDAREITDTGMGHLARLTKLEILELLNPGKTPNAITSRGLRHLANFQQLFRLCIESTRIESLEPLSSLGSLRELTVSGSALIDAGLSGVESGFENLIDLNLDGNRGITDAGLVHLSQLKLLKWLHLSRTAINGPGLVHVAMLSSLEELEASETSLTTEGLASFRNGFPTLTTLNLDGNRGIDDAGLVHLAHLKAISALYLSGTSLRGPGIDHLAGLPKLGFLGLASNPITDDGLLLIKTWPKIGELDLQQTPISEVGLIPVLQSGKPDEVLLHGTKLTRAGIAQLKTQFPGITFSETPSGFGFRH